MAKMPLAEQDNVVKTLPPDRADRPFATSVLPRRSVLQAEYTGLHALRHFYASWCINRKTDGGLELPAKVVQERLGHSSITVTYGHLFPRGDDSAKLAEAESRL
jgi:integrase